MRMLTVDYFLAGDHEAARAVLAAALEEQGFSVTPEVTGVWTVARGNATATALLGAFAGRNKQRLVYAVEFFSHDGALVARLRRDSGAGAMGGVIGVARSNDVFAEVDRAVHIRLAEAGILMNAIRT
jgi:hypothetical protein